MTADQALAASGLLAGLGGVLTGLDAVANRAMFAPGALLDARLGLAPRVDVAVGRWRPAASATVPVGAATAVSAAVLIGAVLIGEAAAAAVAAALLALCVIAQALLLGYGRDGSDEMAVVVCVPVALALIAGPDSVLAHAALAFIAAQLTLSYLTAGAWKLKGSLWRDGSAAARIAATRSYGLPVVGRVLAGRPWLSRAASWGLAAVECTFAVAMLLGGPVIAVALVTMAAFHVQTAVVAGLNRFTPWFVAAFPAAAFVASHVGVLA